VRETAEKNATLYGIQTLLPAFGTEVSYDFTVITTKNPHEKPCVVRRAMREVGFVRGLVDLTPCHRRPAKKDEKIREFK